MTTITIKDHMPTVIYPVVMQFEGMDFDNISMTKVVALCDEQGTKLNLHNKHEVFNQFMEYIRTL